MYHYITKRRKIIMSKFEELTFGVWGNEPIDWLVLKKEGNKAFVVTKYGIDAGPWNEKREDIPWEKCSLRQWLNRSFYYAAFAPDEKEKILTTHVDDPYNTDYDIEGGEEVDDKIFLLSIPEAKELFPDDDSRATCSTDFAKEHGAYTADNDNCWWMLRTRGCHRDFCAYVSSRGVVNSYGMISNYRDFVIRPAMWVEL